MTKKEHILNLQKNWEDFIQSYPKQANTLANLLNTISSDIYSENQRFIFEFIQNADDAAISVGNEIYFDFHDDFLTISHKGKPFDKEDIHAITDAGEGTKSNDITKTGYKGIGFKSVFGKSNKVCIISDGYRLRFDKSFYSNGNNKTKIPWQLIPIWTEFNDFENSNNWEQLENNYTVSTIIELENSLNLKNELNEILSNGKILLFLRKITKISISIKGNLDYTIEKQIHKIEENYDEVKLLKNDKELSSWIVKTFNEIQIDEETQLALKQDDKTPDKLKEAKLTEISFAAKIENGKITEINNEESLIFTFLPTSVTDFGFPFLVNSSFLTTANRQSMHTDSIWNQWLFQLIGKKIFDWFELLSHSKYKFQILHLLPNRFNSINNELKISFDKSFELYGKSKKFVPNKSSQLKRATEIIIDRTGLSEQDFIATEAIIEYINRETGKTFSISSFIHPKLALKHKLNSLGAYTFDLENLEEFFVDEIFKANHQPSQNFSLIKYFYDRDKYLNNKEYTDKLKSLPFIYAKGKKMRSPHQLMFPGIKDLESEVEDEILNSLPKIHKEVNQQIENNIEIKLWLEKLGVKESEQILEALLDNASEIVTEKNYKQITRFLFNQHRKGELESNYYKLANLKLYTTNNSFCEASSCYLSNFYEPTLEIQEYFAEGNYISHEYKEQGDLISEWKTFFIKIGVSETISWVIKSFNRYELSSKYPSYFANIPSGVPNHMYGIKNDFYRYDMNVISFIELTNNYSFSKIFWEIIFKNTFPHYSYKSDMGICYYPTSLTPFNDWIIKNLAIFPTTQKKCLVASEVFINSRDNIEIGGKYLPVFDCNLFPSDNWSDYLPFKKVFELEDYLQVIEAIESDTLKDEELKNINKKRLGLIYNKLKSLIPNLSAKKKNIISEWASSHNLLSDNGTFENANELKWIKIEGFTNTSEHLKLLFIPENCETNNNDFEELLQLFGIQIIDSFIPDIKNKVPNATLKIQLQVILPFLTAIIERKQYLDYSVEFKRLSKIIDNTEFYNASEIVLSFKNQDEIILGPSLHAYLAESELSFKGKWTSPITLYALIPELLKLFKLTGLSDELMLLIQLDENEIKQWLIEQGYELTYIQEKPEYASAIEKVKSYTTEEDTEQSLDLVDNSDERSRITISLEAKEIIFGKLRDKGFTVPNSLEINYTIVRGIKNPKGLPIKVVVKSGKAGKLYFNPSEWLALTEPDTQLFVVTRGNIVRNVTLEDLTAINDTFHMRFNTQAFAVNTNLKAFANFFRYLPYTHFIFDTPESTTDYLQQFGLNERNPSSKELSSDDKNLLH